MLKHNKKKNIAIIHEQLLSLAARLAFEKKQEEFDCVISVLKENFTSGNEIYKEKKVFDCILSACVKDPHNAEKILEESLNELKLINPNKLDKEKNKLISEIYKLFGKDFFSISIKDYKLRASLGILSEEIRKNFLYSTPLERTKIKKNLVENMLKSYSQKQEDSEYVVDNLTYKILIEKFNKRYSSVLNENQKEILSNYVNFLLDNKSDFGVFMKQKSKLILNEINVLDLPMNNEFNEQLLEVKDNLKNEDFKVINEENVYTVMRYFDLVDDLKEYINEQK